MNKRIEIDQACGLMIDVQEFFLAQLPENERSRIEAGTINVIRLLSYLQIPLIATVERPVERKGMLPAVIAEHFEKALHKKVLEKDFFDLAKESPIRESIQKLSKKQMIVFGCETDVCVLQSCLGLLELGYQVFVLEDLLFSSAMQTGYALKRLYSAGAVIMTYKTLFHELLAAREGSPHRLAIEKPFGTFPTDLADA